LNFFFVHEHLQRFLSTVHHREGAWWYFIPIGLAGFLPWLALSSALPSVVRGERRGSGFRPVLLLLVWAASIFVFFSFSSSKLPGYILPIYPALAIIAALALDKLRPAQWGRQVVIAGAFAGCALLSLPLVARLGSPTAPNALYRAFVPWLGAACVLALAGMLVAWRLRSSDPGRSIVVYALTFFLAETVALRGHEVFGRIGSGADLVARIEAVAEPGLPIYSVRVLDHTLPFYLRRTMVIVEEPGELEFGTRQEPDKWLPTLDLFERRWMSGAHALALMSPQTYELLRQHHLPMTSVAADQRRVVVANFEPAPR
ncbi:MAG: 4-amino-4-deoxy-L-arabinose transferase, partial [Pseudomonadota bacterium]|nr:4-amino-4-deoxy-L-arabinose transferase [Pseudomonadota bacterium]